MTIHMKFMITVASSSASVLLINNLYLLHHAKSSINYASDQITLYPLVISILVMFSLIYLVTGNYKKQITKIRYRLNNSDRAIHHSMEKALRESINKKELQVVYQPIVSLKIDSISLETLVRWKYKGKWVSPLVFVPLIEEMGLIDDLTSQVVNKVLTDWDFWEAEIPELCHVSLNISPLMLQGDEPSSFLERLLEGLEAKGIKPQQICLEITENVLLDHRTLRFIEDCTKHGFLIAIDDFGTGYSSMSYIANYPFDVLKIDRSFVEQLETNKKQQVVASMIVQLAKRLNIIVVAEGVETEEQLNILKGMGADAVQGYYFSKPQFVKEWNSQHLNEKLRLLRT